MGGQEQLPAAALGGGGRSGLPESSPGSEEVPPGKTAATPTQGGQAIQSWAWLLFQMLLERKAVIIQTWLRGRLERRRYRRACEAAVVLQCCVRRWRAKRELKSLKREARSVEHLQKLNVGMENKILQLQHKINQQVGSMARSYPSPWSVPASGLLFA